MMSKNYLLVAVVIMLGVVFFPVHAKATTYYVNKTGNDNHGCTNNTTDACLTIQRGINVAQGVGGNVLSVGTGTYSESPSVSTGGASGNPFIVQGFAIAGSCPTTSTSDIYSPTGTRPNPSVLTNGWTISGNYIRMDCFKTSQRISLSGTGNVVQNNYGNLAGTNMDFVDGGGTNCMIQHNYIYRAHEAITISNSTGCVIFENEYDGLQLVGATVSSSDMDYGRIFGSSNITYRHNYMHNADLALCGNPASTNCHVDCLQTWNSNVHDIIWDRNVCFNSLDGFMWEDYTNQNAGYGVNYTLYNLSVTNSIFGYMPGLPPSQGGLAWEGWCGYFLHVGNIKFQNNDCIYKTLWIDHGTQLTSSQNNIFSHNAVNSCTPLTISNGAQAVTENKNIMQSDSCNITAYPNDYENVKFLAVSDSAGDCGTASCIGNFKLQSTSPAIGTGATGLGIAYDLDGNTRDSTPDIGAYVYGAGTSSGLAPPTNLQATPN